MALVNCNLCNNRISTKARFCPKCGCPHIVRDEQSIGNDKNCAACSYAPTEPGLTCNLCDVAESRRPAGQLLNERGDTRKIFEKDDGVSALQQRIEMLEISKDLKSVFNLIALSEREQGPLSEMIDGDDNRLKYFRSMNSSGTICSNWALFLGPAYYFIYGIWKKGGVLTAILMLPLFFLFLSAQAALLTFLGTALYVNATCYCMAKRDRYRLQVLEEDYWW